MVEKRSGAGGAILHITVYSVWMVEVHCKCYVDIRFCPHSESTLAVAHHTEYRKKNFPRLRYPAPIAGTSSRNVGKAFLRDSVKAATDCSLTPKATVGGPTLHQNL